jgi:hypothetical protein
MDLEPPIPQQNFFESVVIYYNGKYAFTLGIHNIVSCVSLERLL